MEIVKYDGHYAVIDSNAEVEFEGTEEECEDYILETQDDTYFDDELDF